VIAHAHAVLLLELIKKMLLKCLAFQKKRIFEHFNAGHYFKLINVLCAETVMLQKRGKNLICYRMAKDYFSFPE